MTLGRLSYWEEVEVNRQIQTLMDLGKNSLEYTCSVTLLMKKDGNKRFYGDSQQHILGFAIGLYNYILVKKDICD
jgi:hypothetical protein